MTRQAFADFLDRLAAGTSSRADWAEYAVNHYQDEKLEAYRRDCVRLAIQVGEPFPRPTQTAVSSLLWLLLLIPAFFFFGKGFTDVFQAQQIRRRIKQAALDDQSNESLPPGSIVDALKRTISGELRLPSVTERTTRDLK